MIGRAVRRLRAVLGGATQEDAARWHRRYEEARDGFKERERRERDERTTIKLQSARRGRRIPSVEAMRHALQRGLPRAQALAAMPDAKQRAVRWAAAAADDTATAGSFDTLAVQARCTTIDGLEWWVPAPATQSAASIARTMAKQGLPYRAISQTRDALVGGVMLDLGANIGATAIPRVILGDARLVLCAEPDDLNHRCLVANITRNHLDGLLLPDRVAIGDRIGTAALERGKMPGSHRVVHGSAAGTAGVELATSALVRSTTVDAWLAQHQVDPAEVTFVKVDTQGSELRVLNGASALLTQPQVTWQIEVAPRLLRLAGSEPGELYRLLRERFTHFIDLNPDAAGERVRAIAELGGALEYLEGGHVDQTDLVLYRLPGAIAT